MPAAFIPGFGKKRVRENIRVLMAEGKSRNAAIFEAMRWARVSYWHRHPYGLLPSWIAYPPGKRQRSDYDKAGRPRAPLTAEAYRTRRETLHANPARELRLTPAQRAAIRRQLTAATGGGELGQAARLYADFTGHDDLSVRKISISDLPRVALDIGHVTGIMYETVREGRVENYIHRFKRASRPLLAASPDGKQLYLLGGAYDFTERGIVDRN